MKSILRIALIFLMVACIPVAFAAADIEVAPVVSQEPVVEIQLDGANMQFKSGVRPYFDNTANRTFVPFRDLFEAMGATVEYDAGTRMITAVRGDTTVQFSQDGTDIKLTKGTVVSTVVSDVTPITREDRVMVPVRFVCQALGANVGWDQANQTVVVIDTPTVIEDIMKDFTIIQKLNAITPDYSKGSIKVDITADGKITTDGINIPFTMVMETLANETHTDSKVTTTADLSALDDLDELEELEGFTITDGKFSTSFDMLVDMGTLTYHYLSADINRLMGLADGTWIKLSLTDLLALAGEEMPIDLNLIDATTSDADALELMLNQVPLTSTEDYAELVAMMAIVKAAIGDQAFKTNGNVLTAEYKIDSLTLVTTITLDSNGNAVSYKVAVAIKDETVDMTFEIAGTSDTLTVKMLIDAGDAAVEFNLAAKMTPSDAAPRTAPPAGAVIINVADFFANLPMPLLPVATLS